MVCLNFYFCCFFPPWLNQGGGLYGEWCVFRDCLLCEYLFMHLVHRNSFLKCFRPIIFVGFLIGNKCILYVILILIFCFCVNYSIDRNANWDHFQSGQCIFVFLGSTLFEVYFKGDISLRFPLCLVLVFPQAAGGPTGT